MERAHGAARAYPAGTAVTAGPEAGADEPTSFTQAAQAATAAMVAPAAMEAMEARVGTVVVAAKAAIWRCCYW